MNSQIRGELFSSSSFYYHSSFFPPKQDSKKFVYLKGRGTVQGSRGEEKRGGKGEGKDGGE